MSRTITESEYKMNQERIELLHQQGKMPDWIYYQQINKPVLLKLQEQKQEMLEQLQQKNEERELKELLEKQISEILESIMDNLSL